jgi:hypothetical protein
MISAFRQANPTSIVSIDSSRVVFPVDGRWAIQRELLILVMGQASQFADGGIG